MGILYPHNTDLSGAERLPAGKRKLNFQSAGICLRTFQYRYLWNLNIQCRSAYRFLSAFHKNILPTGILGSQAPIQAAQHAAK